MKYGLGVSSRVAFCAVLCLMLCGCDMIYRLLDKEGAQERDLIGDIMPNEGNPVVEEAQALLYLYGYNTGKVDGILGLRTRNAIEKFQVDNGLKPSRFLDSRTWEELSVFKEIGLISERQLDIKFVQTILKEAGFNPGKIDGRLGDRTVAAINRFQQSEGLKVDGKIGYQTLKKLSQYISLEPQMEQ